MPVNDQPMYEPRKWAASMPNGTKTKICGVRTPAALEAALAGGADMVGFVFFPQSPRHLSPAAAAELSARIKGRAELVALSVDAPDVLIDEIVAACAPQWLQLHGSESVKRVAELSRRTGCKILKAVKVSSAADLKAAAPYVDVADMLLYDAKAPQTLAEALPGGNGLQFDWELLRKAEVTRPFMLSGGLDAGNVAEAIERVRPDYVDVSSGVESQPGEKDAELIAAFLARVKDTNVKGFAA